MQMKSLGRFLGVLALGNETMVRKNVLIFSRQRPTNRRLVCVNFKRRSFYFCWFRCRLNWVQHELHYIASFSYSIKNDGLFVA